MLKEVSRSPLVNIMRVISRILKHKWLATRCAFKSKAGLGRIYRAGGQLQPAIVSSRGSSFCSSNERDWALVGVNPVAEKSQKPQLGVFNLT